MPPELVRSSLGLAYKIEPDPGANRRPGSPPRSARERNPRPLARTRRRKPPNPITRERYRSTRLPTQERRTGRSETDQPPGAAAQDGRVGIRAPDHGDGRSPSRRRALSRVKVGCSSPMRPRGPLLGRSSRSHDLPWVHSRTLVRARPRPGCSALRAPPKRCRDRGRAKGSSSTAVGKPIPASERTGSARRPRSRAISTKLTPFRGRRDPACRRPRAGVRRALTRRPHTAPDSNGDDGCRLPIFARKGGEAEGDAGQARPPGGERAEARSLWSLVFGTRRQPERRALLRAHAAR